MKETNMEHYRGEIEELLKLDDEGELYAVVNGKPALCFEVGCCIECELEDKADDCIKEFIKWLMSEYKPELVMTAREKHFVEFAQEGWLARDKDGELWWYSAKPKRAERVWVDGQYSLGFRRLLDFNQHFRFITWEDEEPWSVEELRKLKALEYNPEDVAFKDGDVE